MKNRARPVSARASEGGCWPTYEQELLLKASLLAGREAVDAWEEWASRADVDDLDQGSLRLLPLLYKNLGAHGLEDTSMEKFKGVYRLTWYKNQMLFHVMASLLEGFHSSGIQTMVFKGVALVLLYYKDHGLRPMDDLDVMVRREQALDAIELMTAQGWRPDLLGREKFSETVLSTSHALAFVSPDGCQLDLHWHLLPECCYEKADDDFWDASQVMGLDTVTTRALDPTDELLHLCARGTWWNPVPPIRWVADSIKVIGEKGSGIDWGRLVFQARKRRLIVPMRNALGYLRDLFGAPVSPEALQSLGSMTVSRIEQMEYRVRGRPQRLTGSLLTNWFLYLRSTQLEGCSSLRARFYGFPGFLRDVWGAERLWKLPFYALSRGVRRVFMLIRGGG